MAAQTVTIETVQIKRSSGPGVVPDSLLRGEEFVNFADGIRLIGDGRPVAQLERYPLIVQADLDAKADLADLGGAAALNVGTAAGTVAAGNDSRITGALQKADNLGALTDKAASRGNLGLGAAATKDVGASAGQVAAGDDSRLTGALQKTDNLSALTDKAAARTALELGSAATRNIGAVSGSVAAGDDARIVAAGLSALRLGLMSSTPFNLLWTGQSNTVGVGEGGDLTIEAGIQVWNDVLNVYQTAVYGTYPLNMKTPSGAQAVNPGISLLNEIRRSGTFPADRLLRWHMVAQGGKSRSNWIALKQNTNGQVQGQFVLVAVDAIVAAAGLDRFHLVGGIHGEADGTTTTADVAQVGGAWPVTPWPFGNNATGLVAGPDFPQTMVDAIVAAGGFNTPTGYRIATDGFVAALRRRSYCPANTPFVWGEIHGYWNADRPLRNDYYAAYAAGIDPFVGVASTVGLKSSAEPGNDNHWDGASSNIVGRRMYEKWSEMQVGASSSGLNDLYGNKVAVAYYLNILGCTDAGGQGGSNSKDGLSYSVSPEQMKNGAAVRVASAAGVPAKIIIPNANALIGAPDFTLKVWSVSNGSTFLYCQQTILGLPMQPSRETINGVSYNRYEINTVSLWRLTAGAGQWQLLDNPNPLGLQRGATVGLTTIGTNASILYLSGAAVTGNTLSVNYTLAGTTNTVTVPFSTAAGTISPAEQTIVDLAAALKTSLLTVQTGWDVLPILGGVNAVTITGPAGQAFTVNAASTVTGGASQAYWTWRPNTYAAPSWQAAGLAFNLVSGVCIVLPPSNASAPGSFFGIVSNVAGSFNTVDCWPSDSILDKFGNQTVGTAGAVPPVYAATGTGIEYQGAAASRWHPLGGSALGASNGMLPGGTIGTNPYRINLTGPLVSGNTLTIQASLNGTALAQVQASYPANSPLGVAAASQAALAQAAAQLMAALNAVVAGWDCHLVPGQNVLQIDGPASNTITLTSGTVTGGGSAATVSLDSVIYNLTPAQTRGLSYQCGANVTYLFPNPNGTCGRFKLVATSSGLIRYGSAGNWSVRNRAGSPLASPNVFTQPQNTDTIWESDTVSQWTGSGGSGLAAAGVQYIKDATGVTARSGYSRLRIDVDTASGTALASLGVTGPSNPVDGDRFAISALSAITTLTVNAGSGSGAFRAAPTSMTQNGYVEWEYSSAAASGAGLWSLVAKG